MAHLRTYRCANSVKALQLVGRAFSTKGSSSDQLSADVWVKKDGSGAAMSIEAQIAKQQAMNEHLYRTMVVPKEFASKQAERDHIKHRLVCALRLFARLGFDEGAAGHFTARDPERTDCFWVNPFGVHWSVINPSHLICVNRKGEVVEGTGILNQAAFAIHSAVHAARPDVHAAAHTHSTFGRAWSSLGRLLDPISQDACAFYKDHGLYGTYGGVAFDADEGAGIAKAIGTCKACILQNHGLLTAGRTVDEAAWWYVAMERSCQVQLLAEGTGAKPTTIPDPLARLTNTQVGSPFAGWFSFQPLYQSVLAQNPDLATAAAKK